MIRTAHEYHMTEARMRLFDSAIERAVDVYPDLPLSAPSAYHARELVRTLRAELDEYDAIPEPFQAVMKCLVQACPRCTLRFTSALGNRAASVRFEPGELVFNTKTQLVERMFRAGWADIFCEGHEFSAAVYAGKRVEYPTGVAFSPDLINQDRGHPAAIAAWIAQQFAVEVSS